MRLTALLFFFATERCDAQSKARGGPNNRPPKQQPAQKANDILLGEDEKQQIMGALQSLRQHINNIESMVVRGQMPHRYKPGDASTVGGGGGADAQLAKILDSVEQMNHKIENVQGDYEKMRREFQALSQAGITAVSSAGIDNNRRPNVQCRRDSDCGHGQSCVDAECISRADHYSNLQKDTLHAHRPTVGAERDHPHSPNKYSKSGSATGKEAQAASDRWAEEQRGPNIGEFFMNFLSGAFWVKLWVVFIIVDLIIFTRLIIAFDSRSVARAASLERWKKRHASKGGRPYLAIAGYVIFLNETHMEQLIDIYVKKILLAAVAVAISRLPMFFFGDDGTVTNMLTAFMMMFRALAGLMFFIQDDMSTTKVTVVSPEQSVGSPTLSHAPYPQSSYGSEHHQVHRQSSAGSIDSQMSPRLSPRNVQRQRSLPSMQINSPHPQTNPDPHFGTAAPPQPDFGLSPDRAPMPQVQRRRKSVDFPGSPR